mgnify:CR=1 FL=1
MPKSRQLVTRRINIERPELSFKIGAVIDMLARVPVAAFSLITADGQWHRITNPHSFALLANNRTFFVAKSGKPGHTFIDLCS